MTIKYNNKVIAGKYKEQVIPFANTVDAGIAKIATQEQINEGTDNTSIVTPVYLAQKQDKLTAGEGIDIDATNTISSKVLPDKVTIVENDNKTLSTVARKTINEKLVFDWEGTEAEYHQAIMNGEIDPDWYCYITDDELSVSYNDVLSRTLVNIAPDGVKVLGASNAYLTNDVYIDEAGYNQLLELKNSATKIDNKDNITVNGVLVEIPYVLTHTGSKITDAKYRDILVDFYNENGYTNYFTIDEENKNYTLPMGEIYGKLVDKDLSDISEIAKDIIKDIAGVSFNLFDTKIADHELSLEESLGWALQGTYVYKEAITGERFGYPTFYERCIEEKNAGTAKSVTLGSSTITMYVNDNGHQFYNIADKSIVDTYYTSFGIADFYGIDEENECIFLPRNKWFVQLTDSTANVNKFTEAGLPNITGEYSNTGRGELYSADSITFKGALQRGASNKNTATTANKYTGYGFKFDASASNPIYGKSTTVQPQSSSKLLYYCVGNTKADTSWVNVFAQVEEGIKEIYDQKAEILEEIDILRETSVNEIDTLKQDSINEIDTLRATSVNEISTLNTGSLDQIEALKDKSISEINVLKVDSTNEINTLKRTSLNEISTLKQDSVNEIDTLRQNSVDEVDTLRETSVEEIGALKLNSIDEMEDKRVSSNESITTTKDESITELLDATADKIQEAKSWSIGTEEERPEGSAKYWAEVAELSSSNALFDTKISDHILKDSEAYGWELQGTYVYKNAVIGKHLGYPDFYNKCLEEYNAAKQVTSTITAGNKTINMYIHSNGHHYYNASSYKTKIDDWYNTFGIADFYGVDEENERVFLPRNKYFNQLTDDTSKVNQMLEAGLPNLVGEVGHIQFMGLKEPQGVFSLSDESGSNSAYEGNTTTPYVLKFNASEANPIYGNSDTVQPPSSLKLLYYCVGNTVVDTSWVDVVTQVETGVKDLEDATNKGVERLKQSSTALTQTQITNCLLEVPQNINVELVNGQVVLKAGSKVIVPNGVNRFDEITVQTDRKTNISSGANQIIVLYRGQNTSLGIYTLGFNIYSGATAPTEPIKDSIWYDTTNNLIKITTDNGTTWTTGEYSLPVCIATRKDGVVTSIDQVFNGFGYIGSTVWVDKGVKGLIPNGRNEDGTLKNIEYTSGKIAMYTFAESRKNWRIGLATNNGIQYSTVTTYDATNNINVHPTLGKVDAFFVASCDTDSLGKITSFNPKLPFRAVDYSDKSEVSGWAMPSNKYIDLTLGASGTQYTAPANGWFWFLGSWSNQNGYIQLRAQSTGYRVQVPGISINGFYGLMLPIKKEDICMVAYTVAPSNVTFRFIYAEGEV